MDSALNHDKPSNPSYPVYPSKIMVYLFIFWLALFGKQRSFHRDSLRMMGKLRPPLRVWGADRIPNQLPCLITLNHYNRPGFNAMWIGMAVSSVARREIHWLMTSAWTFEGMWYAPLARKISQWVIRRLAVIYGMTTTPPNPPDPADAADRGTAIRRLMAYIRHTPAPLIAITPEGRDFPRAVLGYPPPGFGRLAGLLAQRNFVILPAGIYEHDGALCLRFGTPYRLKNLPAFSKQELDRKYSLAVMARIASTLPAHLQGEYACYQNTLHEIVEDLP